MRIEQRWIAWFILIAGMFLCRAAFLDNVVYNIDEAEYGVAAHGLDHGLLSGVDFLGSNKTPGIVFLYDGLFHVCGRSLAVARCTEIVMLIAMGWLAVELAISLWGLYAAIPTAVLFWMVSNSFSFPADILPLNTETPATVLALLAVWLAWSRPRNARAVVSAGAALGLALIFRQSALFFVIPVFTALLLTPERRMRRIVYAAVGGIAAWLPLLILYAAHHGLGWAWDSWVRYPLEYSHDTGWNGFMERFFFMSGEFGTQEAVPVCLLFGGAVLLVNEGSTSRVVFLASLLAGSFLALCTGSRFFGHYWIQMYPIVTLVAVPAWLYLAKGARKARLVLGVAVLVGGLVAALHYNTWRSWDKYAPPRGVSFFHLGQGSTEVDIAAFTREHTAPDETVCVWGYCPQIYWYSNRLPGVRDFICHYVCGYSPGVSNTQFVSLPEKRKSGHRGAVQMFIDDLERSKAKYIFDLTPIRNYTFTFYDYPIADYPELEDYVLRNYLPQDKIGKALVFRRRTANDASWPPDWHLDEHPE